MLKNLFNGCRGNHTFSHSAKEFIFKDENSLHSWGPNERFGAHENCPGCKAGQMKIVLGAKQVFFFFFFFFFLFFFFSDIDPRSVIFVNILNGIWHGILFKKL